MNVRAVFIIATGLFIAGIAGVFSPQVSARDEASVPSAEKIAAIQSRCDAIQTNLNQLHTTDALLRVNRGQVYASISADLMAKLNSRIALNRLDGSQLIQVTNTYEDHHAMFRQAYQEYSDEIAKLMGIDCENKPYEFYESLVAARQKRARVHESVKLLNENIGQYQAAFTQFRERFEQRVANE